MIGLQVDGPRSMRILELRASASADVERIEVRTSKDQNFTASGFGWCTRDQQQLIEQLWDEVPDTNLFLRCHFPGFAIEVFVQDESVFRAALCWECNTISIGGRCATTDWRNFDAKSHPAQRLLDTCKQVVSIGSPAPRG